MVWRGAAWRGGLPPPHPPGGIISPPGQRAARWCAGLATLLALTGTSIAVASEVGDGDADSLTGSTLEEASAAALAEVGEGEVTDAESDGTGGYEVEVRLDDGREIDVYLDENFAVRDTQEEDSTEVDDALTGAIRANEKQVATSNTLLTEIAAALEGKGGSGRDMKALADAVQRMAADVRELTQGTATMANAVALLARHLNPAEG